MSAFIDLTGQKFGRLTVIKRVEDHITKGGYHIVRWLCECDCGNTVIVNGNSLRRMNTVSCGCYRSEVTANKNKRQNNYDLSGEYGVGYTLKGEEFYFDLEDYDKIKNICWRKNNGGYIVGRDCLIKKDVCMHRVVMDYSGELEVDHKHGELTRHDNRKYNLRICTHQENKRNVNLQSNNISGFTGVSWDKINKKWMAHITVDQTLINLGRYSSFEDAKNARINAENELFGEFSYRNSQTS